MLEPPDDIESWEDDESDEMGCLFPENCCMPSEHFKSECMTPEMMEELHRNLEQPPAPATKEGA